MELPSLPKSMTRLSKMARPTAVSPAGKVSAATR